MKYKIDAKTESLLVANGFRKTKNGSLYKLIKKAGRKVLKVRIANHYKHLNNYNEILMNYVVKNNNDIKRLVKKLIKNKIIMEVTQWKYLVNLLYLLFMI